MSDSIKKLTELFSRFPTIGRRTAGRFVYYLINQDKNSVNELVQAIQELKNNVHFCSLCFLPFEGTGQFCHICNDSGRNKTILCIIEKENDLLTIEQTKRYKGLYFILGGSVSAFKPDSKNLRLQPLKARILNGQFNEIIIATNPTPEGKTAAVLVQQTLKELPIYNNLTITRLAQGLPVGGELEYADEETLESAFEGRK